MGWRASLPVDLTFSGLPMKRPSKTKGSGGISSKITFFPHRCQKNNMEWFLGPGVLNARFQIGAKKLSTVSGIRGEPPGNTPSCFPITLFAAKTLLPQKFDERGQHRKPASNLLSSRRPNTPRPTMRNPNNYNDHPQLHFKKSFHIIILTPIAKNQVKSSRWGRVLQNNNSNTCHQKTSKYYHFI